MTITRPGASDPQVVTMARREPISTMNEELRRLTPDHIHLNRYAQDAGPAYRRLRDLMSGKDCPRPAR